MPRIPGTDRIERRRFVRHFFEMVGAMLVGMAVLGMLVRMLCAITGHQDLLRNAGTAAPIMASNMTLGMVVWMRHRGHGWAATGEMAGAMYVPLVLLLVPFSVGAVTGGTVLGGMHLLMLPAMWFVMVRRPGEYLHDHGSSVAQFAESAEP